MRTAGTIPRLRLRASTLRFLPLKLCNEWRRTSEGRVSSEIEQCIQEYRKNRHHLSAFAESIRQFFEHHPELSSGPCPLLHSTRLRLKNEDHLRDKLKRKQAAGRPVSPANLLAMINDLVGVR